MKDKPITPEELNSFSEWLSKVLEEAAQNEEIIKRQKANAEGLTNAVRVLNEQLSSAKAEAYREFAERYERWLLSQLTTAPLDKKEWINFCLDELDNLKKEMVGDTK